MAALHNHLPPLTLSLASFSTLKQYKKPEFFTNWGANNFPTYILLPKGYAPERLEAHFPDFMERHTGEGASADSRLHLMRLTDIRLHSHLDAEQEPNSDIAYIYLFSAIAFFVLMVACINFMTLATARSASRAREVGMRKVVGAHRVQVIRQFLGESILLAFLALFLALALVEIALPAFKAFFFK